MIFHLVLNCMMVSARLAETNESILRMYINSQGRKRHGFLWESVRDRVVGLRTKDDGGRIPVADLIQGLIKSYCNTHEDALRGYIRLLAVDR